MKTKSQFGGMAMPVQVAMATLLSAVSIQAAKPGGAPPPPSYTYVRLGTLGLPYAYSGGKINQQGMVAGTVCDSASYTYGFVVVPKDSNNDGQPDVWYEDQNADGLNDLQLPLGPPAGFELPRDIIVDDINDRGQVLLNCYWVGEVRYRMPFVLTPEYDATGKPTTWFRDDGAGGNALMQPVLVAPQVGSPYAEALNNRGQVVGNGTVEGYSMGFVVEGADTNGDGIADTWFLDLNSDGLNDLVQLLGHAWDLRHNAVSVIRAYDLNDNGQIAGDIPSPLGDWGLPCALRPEITAEGFLWCVDDNGDGLNDLPIRLPTSDPSQWGSAYGINAAGKLVGWSHVRTRGGDGIGMLWDLRPDGTIQATQLPVIPGADIHMAQAINARDMIVGGARTYAREPLMPPKYQGAVLWQNGKVYDLRTLTDQAASLEGAEMSATDINDAGMIVGRTTQLSESHPFIAIPRP